MELSQQEIPEELVVLVIDRLAVADGGEEQVAVLQFFDYFPGMRDPQDVVGQRDIELVANGRGEQETLGICREARIHFLRQVFIHLFPRPGQPGHGDRGFPVPHGQQDRGDPALRLGGDLLGLRIREMQPEPPAGQVLHLVHPEANLLRAEGGQLLIHEERSRWDTINTAGCDDDPHLLRQELEQVFHKGDDGEVVADDVIVIQHEQCKVADGGGHLIDQLDRQGPR